MMTDYGNRLQLTQWINSMHVPRPTTQQQALINYMTNLLLLPFGITVVAQIPPPLQTVRTGRGFEAVVTGRVPEHSHGIKLFNPATKREITRRTFKVIGDHPIKGLIFDNPITIEISPDDDDIEITNDNEAYLSRLVSGTENNYDNTHPTTKNQ